MSPFQVTLLAIFGACGVAGILVFAFLVGSNTGNSIGPVTIWGTFDDALMQTVIRQLSEEDNRLRQVTYVRKNRETFSQELVNALASGAGPDLYLMRNDAAVADATKVIAITPANLTLDQFQNMFAQAAWGFYGTEGAIAVPLVVDPFVLYWNRDLLSANGIAEPPARWDQVPDMARKITDCARIHSDKQTLLGCDESRSIKKATISFGESQNVDHVKEIVSMLIMQAGGSITARDGTGTLVPSLTARGTTATQPGESALAYYTGYANPANDYYSWNRSLPSSRQAFAAGDLALYIGPVSEIALIRSLNPNLNFGVAPVPQVKDSARAINTGHTYAFAVPRTAKNREGALTVAYLLASPAGSKTFATVLGMSSARLDVLGQPAKGIDELITTSTLLVRAWEDPNPGQTARIFHDMITSVTSGAARVNEALQRADQAMRLLL